MNVFWVFESSCPSFEWVLSFVCLATSWTDMYDTDDLQIVPLELLLSIPLAPKNDAWSNYILEWPDSQKYASPSSFRQQN